MVGQGCSQKAEQFPSLHEALGSTLGAGKKHMGEGLLPSTLLLVYCDVNNTIFWHCFLK